MAFQLMLPDIGEGVIEAEILRWLVAPGEQVEEDQPLVEVMTDKATVTIPSPRRGRVARLCCEVGEVAQVHAPLVELEVEEGAEVPAPSAPATGGRAPPPAAAAAGPARGRKALATP